MRMHEGRATGAGGAASRRRGADNGCLGGLLALFVILVACGEHEPAPSEASSVRRSLPSRGLELLDSNAPVPAEVLAMVGSVPRDSLRTQLVWLGPADGDRVGIALVAYDEQDRRLAERIAAGELGAVRARMQQAANDCQEQHTKETDEAEPCLCCLSCFEQARRSVLGPRRAVFHLLRVTKPAQGPAHLDHSTHWEREGRLLAANIHWVSDEDGDGRAEIDLTTVVAPRPGEGCTQAGIHERILDADTFQVQLDIERDTELEREDHLTLAHRYELLPREEGERTHFEVHEAWWSGDPAPPDIMPEGDRRVATPEEVRRAFEAGRRAWWDERYRLRYDAEADRWVR